MSTVPPLVQYAGFPVEGFDFATSCGDGDPYSGPFRDARCWLPRPVVPFVERLTKALNKAQVDVTAATPPGSWGARRIREVHAPVPGPYFTTDAYWCGLYATALAMAASTSPFQNVGL